MQRLTKTAGILDTLLRVLYWILVVAAIIAACGCVLSFISHLVDLEETSPIFGIDLDFLTLELADNVIPPETASKVQQAVSLASMVCLIAGAALGAYCIQLLRTILQPMKEGQPFQSSVGADLKKLAWLELIGGGILSILEVVIENLIVYGYDLHHLLLSDKITAVTFNLELDMSFLITAGVCFLLSYIFTYGSELQQLSDETL